MSELTVLENNGVLETEGPETKETIVFSGDDFARLTFCEMQIGMGAHVIATSLKTIRDSKLYLIRGCASMKEYAYEYMNLSDRTVRNYIRLAESFSSAEKVKAISEVGITKALQLIQDPEFVESAEQANDAEIKELIHGRLAKIEKMNEKIKKENKELKAKLDKEIADKKKAEGSLQNLEDEIALGKFEPIRSKKTVMAGLLEFYSSLEKFDNLIQRNQITDDIEVLTTESSIFARMHKALEILEPSVSRKLQERGAIQDAEVVDAEE